MDDLISVEDLLRLYGHAADKIAASTVVHFNSPSHLPNNSDVEVYQRDASSSRTYTFKDRRDESTLNPRVYFQIAKLSALLIILGLGFRSSKSSDSAEALLKSHKDQVKQIVDHYVSTRPSKEVQQTAYRKAQYEQYRVMSLRNDLEGLMETIFRDRIFSKSGLNFADYKKRVFRSGYLQHLLTTVLKNVSPNSKQAKWTALSAYYHSVESSVDREHEETSSFILISIAAAAFMMLMNFLIQIMIGAKFAKYFFAHHGDELKAIFDRHIARMKQLQDPKIQNPKALFLSNLKMTSIEVERLMWSVRLQQAGDMDRNILVTNFKTAFRRQIIWYCLFTFYRMKGDTHRLGELIAKVRTKFKLTPMEA